MDTKKGSNFINQSIKDGPLNDGNRDILMVAERWLKTGPYFPPVDFFKDIFKGIDEYHWNQVTNLSFCTSNAIKLNLIPRLPNRNKIDHKYIHDAILIYTLEAQRILSALFTYDHGFWKTYYNKVSQLLNLTLEPKDHFITQNSFFLLPMDAIHELSLRSYSLEYEMISQSFQAILTAHDPEIIAQDRSFEFLNLSLRIIRNIPIKGYDLWVRNIFNSKI